MMVAACLSTESIEPESDSADAARLSASSSNVCAAAALSWGLVLARTGMATRLGIPASPSPLDTRALVVDDEVNVIEVDEVIARGGGEAVLNVTVIRLITCLPGGILDAQASKTPRDTRGAPNGRLAMLCA